jgi:hypothetical protein
MKLVGMAGPTKPVLRTENYKLQATNFKQYRINKIKKRTALFRMVRFLFMRGRC